MFCEEISAGGYYDEYMETLICTSELVFHQPAHQVGVTVQLPVATGHRIELEMAVKQGHH